MNYEKVFALVGLAVFSTLTLWSMGNDGTLLNFYDPQSLIYVLAGGSALALLKRPENVNAFCKGFSRTSLVAGALWALILFVNTMGWLSFEESTAYVMVVLFARMAIAMLYALLFSVFAYALHREEKD